MGDLEPPPEIRPYALIEADTELRRSKEQSIERDDQWSPVDLRKERPCVEADRQRTAGRVAKRSLESVEIERAQLLETRAFSMGVHGATLPSEWVEAQKRHSSESPAEIPCTSVPPSGRGWRRSVV
jgi:hypothetical protein